MLRYGNSTVPESWLCLSDVFRALGIYLRESVSVCVCVYASCIPMLCSKALVTSSCVSENKFPDVWTKVLASHLQLPRCTGPDAMPLSSTARMQ